MHRNFHQRNPSRTVLKLLKGFDTKKNRLQCVNLTDFMMLALRFPNFDKIGDFLASKAFEKRKFKTMFNSQRSGKWFELQKIVPKHKFFKFYTIFGTYCFFGRNYMKILSLLAKYSKILAIYRWYVTS